MVLPKDTNITPRKYPTIPLGDDFIKQSPADHLEECFNDEIKKNVKEPDALILSTYDGKRVNARTVALRGFEKGEKEKGIFYIYTNYNSAKSKEIEKTKDVSLTFYWPDVFRQIRIIGQAKKCSAEQSDEYFASRPHGSQIGAWTSRQDEELSSRQELLDSYEKFESQFGDKIQRPPFWGGFMIEAYEYEFMQGFESRLHDRFKYVYNESTNQFSCKRLWP